MKYIGVFQSGDVSDNIVRLDRNQVHVTDIPHATTNVKWITGDVKNYSGTGRLRVRFYSSFLENKDIILDPYASVHFKNQPCDRISVVGVANAAALVSYQYTAYETESVSETGVVMANSDMEVSLMDIQNILSQRVVHQLYILNGQTGINVTVPYGREIVLREAKAIWDVGDFYQDNVPDNGYVSLGMDIGTESSPGFTVARMIGSKTHPIGAIVGDWATPLRFESDGVRTQIHFRSTYANIPIGIAVGYTLELAYGII